MSFKDYKLVLASNSPRRKELLKGLDIDFEIMVLPNIDESYPKDLKRASIAEYLARKKALANQSLLDKNTLLITADTTVILENEIFGKPVDLDDARAMLRQLSDKKHLVVTGVCLTSTSKQVSFSTTSSVEFGLLSESDINYYVSKYKPLDKAGAYGIQEWIGYIGVKKIEGSYFNIMGLPVYELYKQLQTF